MEILVRNQNKAVIFSLILGLFVGILYDFFKLLRKLALPQGSLNKLRGWKEASTNPDAKKTTKKSAKIAQLVLVALFDLSFCLLLCPIFCVFSYIMVNGRFRWFIFAAAFLGALIYKGTLGRAIGIIIDYLSCFIFRFRHFLFEKIKKPLKKLSGKMKSSRAKRRKRREESAQKKQRKVVFSYGKGG